MMILFPTVSKIWQISRDNHVMGRLQELAQGCGLYKSDNHAYPGQANSNLLYYYTATSTAVGTTPSIQYGISGSQMLAACMFNNLDANYNDTVNCSFTKTHNGNGTTNNAIPTEHYARLSIIPDNGTMQGKPADANLTYGYDPVKNATTNNSKTDLLDVATTSGIVNYWTIADQNGRQNMPILYYPSRVGVPGVGQYLFTDNYNLTINYTARGDLGGQTRCWAQGPYTSQQSVAAVNANWGAIWGSIPTADTATPPNVSNIPQIGSFYSYLIDNRLSTTGLPASYRDGEFVLIAPGADGVYGTSDDVRFAFGN
jgi:hypothetical protein